MLLVERRVPCAGTLKPLCPAACRLYDLAAIWERCEGQMIVATPLPMAGSHLLEPQHIGALQIVLQGPFDSVG